VVGHLARVADGILGCRGLCGLPGVMWIASGSGGGVGGDGRRARHSCRDWLDHDQPSAQCSEMSHQRAGSEHPGNAHPPSRRITARRIAVGTVRLVRPTSSDSLREPSTTGMIPASRAIRRAISALIGPPSAGDAVPIRSWRTGRLTVTTTWGRSPPRSVAHPRSARCRRARRCTRHWGDEPFRIGLWVAGGVSPERWDEAEKQIADALAATTPAHQRAVTQVYSL
jgi:hypothetical protein